MNEEKRKEMERLQDVQIEIKQVETEMMDLLTKTAADEEINYYDNILCPKLKKLEREHAILSYKYE